MSLTDTTSKIENLKNAYREIKESIKIKPYCYNLYLAYVLAKQLGTTELESHEYLVEMQNIMRPIDRHIYDDILKELFNLTKEDIKNINSDKNELLKLSCKDIDMGKIKLKDKQKFSFEIINHHSEPVIVKAIRASCTCVEINIPKEPILPNKSSVINGFFKAKHKGKFSRILFIHTNSRQLPLKTVVIKGTVI